jgi:uncharacterized protein (TIGR03083 family)
MTIMQPILTADLFAPLNDELVALLRGLAPDEWNAPTVAAGWTVKDIAAHLLDTALRRLGLRDGYLAPGPFEPNRMNREWVEAARRLSPRLLTDMLDRYGREAALYLASLDPFARAGFAVTWAGDEESPAWFDVARELTERWHHQQQIRDATHRPPLYDAVYFAPVIATFVRALPHTYREVDAPAGTTVVLRVTGEGEGTWSLTRENARWSLREGEARAAATVTMRGDTAWRLFTRQNVADRVRIDGDPRYGEPLLKTVAII